MWKRLSLQSVHVRGHHKQFFHFRAHDKQCFLVDAIPSHPTTPEQLFGCNLLSLRQLIHDSHTIFAFLDTNKNSFPHSTSSHSFLTGPIYLQKEYISLVWVKIIYNFSSSTTYSQPSLNGPIQRRFTYFSLFVGKDLLRPLFLQQLFHILSLWTPFVCNSPFWSNIFSISPCLSIFSRILYFLAVQLGLTFHSLGKIIHRHGPLFIKSQRSISSSMQLTACPL